MKKIFSILLCGMFICMGTYMTTEESHAEHWADQYLNNLVSQQIMRGDDEGNLNPENSITRAEFVAMMNRTFGYGDKGSIAFNDVPLEAWYYDEICIAKKQGYFTGIYPDTAGPDTYLKREEAVTMLCRALKIEGIDGSTLDFADSRTFSGWSKAYINAAVEKNFLAGYPDQTFKPTDYMKRGEMAKVLSDVAGEIVKESGSNYIGYANGNVSVVQTGASLRNTIVPGDLYITAGMGKGYTQLENLTVGGDLIISGTGNAESGEVSVILTDCDINNLVIDSNNSEIMSVRAEGGSVIHTTNVKSSTYLEEDNSKGIAFKDVILRGKSGTALSLSGAFENVTVKGENNKLSLDKGSIESLTIDEEAVKGSVFIQKGAVVYTMFCDTATTVTGEGTIEEISINANGCNISMLPDHIYIRPGVTAIIDGKTMTSLDAEANNASPEFMDTYPKYEDLQATSVKLLLKTNKPGKVYWAVKNIDIVNAGMTEEELKLPDKRYVIKSGSVNVVGEKEVTINVSGLKSGVNYEYYMLFEDLKEERTSVESEKFKTVDVIAPTFLNGTPKIASATKDSFTMLVMPSKNVTLCWAVFPNKAVPPTIESLADLKVSGALGKGSVNGLAMNDPKEIHMSGTDDKLLSESVTYDIYMVMKDESGNLSRLAKIIGTTGDDTPPEFMDGYPWNEPGAVTSIKIRHMASEPGTLYWAVYPFDFKVPPVENFDEITDAAIKKELMIRAITTGQKAVKNGKATVADKKDAVLNISGLEKQTPYDIYFLLMDKAGNYSAHKTLLGVKTLDKSAPIATMKFDKVLEGNPLVSSNISVEFDEITYYDGAERDIRLSELPPEQKVTILKSMFSVHDLLSVSKPDYISGISYGAVTIEEKDGKTIVTFPPAAFGDGKGLNSGGNYQFELNNVIDSDGNSMSQAKLLTPFKVVPPQVYMSRYNGNEPLLDNEVGFSIQPIEGVNSDKFFDVIIETDVLINFDLYINYKTTDGAVKTLTASSIRLDKGQARSVASLMPVGTGYDEFVNIQPTNYKIHINTFNAVNKDKITSWNGTINLRAMAVIGEPYNLTNLATEILNARNPLDIVKNNTDTIVVSNPEIFGVKRVYADSAQPSLIDGIKYQTYDTAVNVVVMADKPAKLYYVAVPVANMIQTSAGGITTWKETPTVDQILKGLPAYQESKAGVINLVDGNVEYAQLIDGLIPNTDYKFFYVLKGVAPDNLVVENKDVTLRDFRTEPPIVPLLMEGPIPSGISDVKWVEMRGTANTDARVYWVMYSGGQYTDLTVDQVIALSNSDGTVVDSGNFLVSKTTDENADKEGIQFRFKANNMEPTKTYDVFIALETEYSGIRSIEVFKYLNVRSKDDVPPAISNDPITSITGRDLTSSGGITFAKYHGSIGVNFSEPLYFKNSLSGADKKPLTKEDLVNENGGPAYGGLLSSTGDIELYDIRVTETSDADGGKKPITGFSFKFKNAMDGNVISINGEIYDRAGWHAGRFIMTFIEDRGTPAIPPNPNKPGDVGTPAIPADPLKSHFKVEFVKN